MLPRTFVAVALLVTAGTAAAAASVIQQGECTYTGAWDAQLTPFTDGPGRAQYRDAGACASVSMERTGVHSWRWVLRADSTEASLTDYVVRYGHEESYGGAARGEFTCLSGTCVLGPFDGAHFDWFSTYSCAYVQIWKAGTLHRSARACA